MAGNIERSKSSTQHFYKVTAPLSTDPYKVQFVDEVTLDILSLVGAPYSPDGIAVKHGDKVLFTKLTNLTGFTGRGVYSAHVFAGVLTSWDKVMFGQSPIGDSIEGDAVMILEGVTHNLCTFICTSTPGAVWYDTGTPNSIVVQDEGVIIDTDLDTLNFTGSGVTTTQTALGKVKVDINDVSSNDTLLEITGLSVAGTVFDVTASGATWTKTRDNGYLGINAAAFLSFKKIRVELNGQNREKVISSNWVSATTFTLNIDVNAGDYIKIYS